MRLFLLILLLASLKGSSQLLIRNTTIVDVENKKLVPAQDVLIAEGRISAIGRNLKVPGGVKVIDGSGKWLMPGLVDAHVHFFQSGGLYTRPDAVDLTRYRPYEQELDWLHRNMASFLRRYTGAGITTVVDVGASFAFLRQRDSFYSRSYAPSIYMTGPLLTTWEPAAFKGLDMERPFNLMKDTADARALVRKQLPYKPDFIKVWYILTGRNKDSSVMQSLPLLRAVVDEAHKNGLRVAVHATERVTAKASVEAGADFLVHSVEDEPIDDSFVQLLKKKGTVLCPTLVVAGNYSRSLGQFYEPTAEDLFYAHPTPLNTMFDMAVLKDSALSQRYKKGIQNFLPIARKEDTIRMNNLKKLVEGGVRIATGTDAGNIGTQHVSSYYDELRAMQQSGLNTWNLLEASTINGAHAVGKQLEFGLVKKGQRADLLLLTKDPTLSIENWKSVDWVINKGEAIKPDSLRQYTPEELADQQLVAYNAHNLEAFLEPYAEDVEIYDLNTNKLRVKGKVAMRKEYAFLSTIKVLHCRLLNRIVDGNMVVDHEEITNRNGKFTGLAIYEISGNKIVKVWFPN